MREECEDKSQVRVPHPANQNFGQQLLNPRRRATVKLFMLTIYSRLSHTYTADVKSRPISCSIHTFTHLSHLRIYNVTAVISSHRIAYYTTFQHRHRTFDRKSQPGSHRLSRIIEQLPQIHEFSRCQEEAAGAAAVERMTWARWADKLYLGNTIQSWKEN